MIVVVKIGTSSVTLPAGGVDSRSIGKLALEIAAVAPSHKVVVVSSGAVSAGSAVLSAAHREGFEGGTTPLSADPALSQALSAIGQHRLMRVYDDALGAVGLTAGQVLLAPTDFALRSRYLHARATLLRLVDLGVVPIVNENDAIADDEIRFGDNDRLAALVAHLLRADLLVLLTDQAGLFSADPRTDAGATLIEEVAEIDHELEAMAGGPGSKSARGGMISKLAAAKMAAWSGVTSVIAAADRPQVLADVVDLVTGRRSPGSGAIGTVFMPHTRQLSARKLWIAFALRSSGRLVVDEGARRAIVKQQASLLPAGVVRIEGRFLVDDVVEICDEAGVVFAKGIAQLPADRAAQWVGKRSSQLPHDLRLEAVHRDDLVVLVA